MAKNNQNNNNTEPPISPTEPPISPTEPPISPTEGKNQKKQNTPPPPDDKKEINYKDVEKNLKQFFQDNPDKAETVFSVLNSRIEQNKNDKNGRLATVSLAISDILRYVK